MSPAITASGRQRQGVEISHVILPACRCGHAFAAHACAGWHAVHGGADDRDTCDCHGYEPARPTEEVTTVYQPWTTTRGFARTACLLCWWVEQRARHWRRRLERT